MLLFFYWQYDEKLIEWAMCKCLSVCNNSNLQYALTSRQTSSVYRAVIFIKERDTPRGSKSWGGFGNSCGLSVRDKGERRGEGGVHDGAGACAPPPTVGKYFKWQCSINVGFPTKFPPDRFHRELRQRQGQRRGHLWAVSLQSHQGEILYECLLIAHIARRSQAADYGADWD